jgi:hypothetical protein
MSEAPDVAVWEARAQADIGLMIERYLIEHPPPPGSHHQRLYRSWAADLRDAGEADLAELGAGRLRTA